MGTIYEIIFVPESPEYAHSKKRYDQARGILKYVANYNSVYTVGKNDAPYEKFKFS